MRPDLAGRLRAIIGGASTTGPQPGALPADAPVHGPATAASESSGGEPSSGTARAIPAGTDVRAIAARAAAVLGGRVVEHGHGLCLEVVREYAPAARHGHVAVSHIVAALRETPEGLQRLTRVWPGAAGAASSADGTRPTIDPDTLCVLDLETTGLAGGAGTQAFLIGCAVIDGDRVRVHQFLLPGQAHERAQLGHAAAWMHGRGSLVTFNGRTFDVPLLSMRCDFHRLPSAWDALPHLDVLHPARRLWREGPDASGGLDERRCSLGALETRMGGVRRTDDVPGAEIPARFFQFVRDGDARPLAGVLEHNRLDLLSTLLLLARAVSLAARGAGAAAPGEALGLGQLLERAGEAAEAVACYRLAASRTSGERRALALRALARLERRQGRPEAAAEAWQALLGTRGAGAALRREAREALAIHHEHRSGDLGRARSLALDLLGDVTTDEVDTRVTAVRHRLARLERKLGHGVPGSPLFDDPAAGA